MSRAVDMAGRAALTGVRGGFSGWSAMLGVLLVSDRLA